MLRIWQRSVTIKRIQSITFHRLFSTSKDSENETDLSFTETRHIPAPTVHRPDVSPITQLGQNSEVITSIGDKEEDEEVEKDDAPSVITWIGPTPSEITKTRQSPTRVKMRAPRDLTPVQELPFELIPKFVQRTKPRKLKSFDAMELEKALDQVIQESPQDHDNTLNIHLTLGVDPKKSDQFVRGVSRLPHGTGKRVTIAVFADGVQAEKARKLNVDLVGGLDLIHEVLETQGKNVEHIKRCVATPSMMKELAKAGRILGPRGLMPNPKLGTLTDDVTEAISKLQEGQIEFRVDRMGTMHSALGKISFGYEKLLENVLVFGRDVLSSKPPKFIKRPETKFIKGITICGSDGRGFPVTVPSMIQLIKTRIKM
eukprot:g1176.t1